MQSKKQQNQNQLVYRILSDELGKARSEMQGARQSASQFGMYDDCGPEYERDYIEAKAVVEYLTILREKFAPTK